MLENKTRFVVRVKPDSYEPTEAELNEPILFPPRTTAEVLARALVTPVRIVEDDETHWDRGNGRSACGAPHHVDRGTGGGRLTTNVEMITCLKCLSVAIDAGVTIDDINLDD